MRLPRDISAKKFGYQPTRQMGSHIRLTTQQNGEHHITIPNYNPLKVGTLSGILNDVAQHLGMDKNQLIENL
ncbi:MAG: type II toxin-antitoxin system HicA family toxin [Bacteroidia bacterium]